MAGSEPFILRGDTRHRGHLEAILGLRESRGRNRREAVEADRIQLLCAFLTNKKGGGFYARLIETKYALLGGKTQDAQRRQGDLILPCLCWFCAHKRTRHHCT